MRKKKHKTTKNTMPKRPVTKLAEYTVDINGIGTIVTDILDQKQFDKIYKDWFNSPFTKVWTVPSLVIHINKLHPGKLCSIKEVFDKMVDGNFIPATKEEWEAENN